MEQRDPERQIGPHDPVFALAGGQRTQDIRKLDGKPVQMEQDHGRQREADATDPKNRRVSVVNQVSHAAQEEDGPRARPAHPPDADGVESDLGFGIGRDAELGTHDGEDCRGLGVVVKKEGGVSGLVAAWTMSP